MSGGKQMRSIREMLHKSTYGAAPSMGARLLLYWFTMALLLVAAILSILMATGCCPTRRGSWPERWTFSSGTATPRWIPRWTR